MVGIALQVSQRRLVIQSCDRAIALNPRYVKALLRRFQMHYALGNKEEAILGRWACALCGVGCVVWENRDSGGAHLAKFELACLSGWMYM